MSTLEITRNKPHGFEMCLICRSSTSQDGIYAVATCPASVGKAHAYCAECLKEWALIRPICPMCNENLKPDSFSQLKNYEAVLIQKEIAEAEKEIARQIAIAEKELARELVMIENEAALFENVMERFLYRVFMNPKYREIKVILEGQLDLNKIFLESGTLNKAALTLIPISLKAGLDWSRMDLSKQIIKTSLFTLCASVLTSAALSIITGNLDRTAAKGPLSSKPEKFEDKLLELGVSVAVKVVPALALTNQLLRRITHLIQNFKQLSNASRVELAALLSIPKLVNALLINSEFSSALSEQEKREIHSLVENELKGYFCIFISLGLFLIFGNFLHQNHRAIQNRIVDVKESFDEYMPTNRALYAGAVVAYTSLICMVAPALYSTLRADSLQEQEEARQAILEAAGITVAASAATAMVASKSVQKRAELVTRVIGNALTIATKETVQGGVYVLEQIGRYAWSHIRQHIPRHANPI